MTGSVSRRRMLGYAGIGIAGVAAAGAGGAVARDALAATDPDSAGAGLADAVDFYGEHQAGIITPAQDRLHFVAFDVVTDKRAELIAMLREWTAAAARMTAGHDAGPVGAVRGPAQAPPDDTGEALDLPASQLTLTIGFGPTLFKTVSGQTSSGKNVSGVDRFGIADRRPPALADLPRFPGETLDRAISGGDLCVQACASDPQVAVHAIRNLARIGFGVVSVRWSQLGFGRTSSTSTAQLTARNLMGFKDGTANLKAEQTDLIRDHVWARSGDGPSWMDGGSYLVTRKINMLIETWDRTSLVEQEAIIGRTKGEGAPHGKTAEFDQPDFTGSAIAADAHVRLAHPSTNDGARLLRRGYNFVDGSDGLGRLSAGLFFMAYQRDPRTQFVPVQRRLARTDTLNEYIRHVSSGVFACPPGVTGPDHYWGEALFTA